MGGSPAADGPFECGLAGLATFRLGAPRRFSYRNPSKGREQRCRRSRGRNGDLGASLYSDEMRLWDESVQISPQKR